MYSIEGIVAFSTIPLLISSFIGLIFYIMSFIMICIIILRIIILGDPVAGCQSIVCSIFFVGGIQLFCTGNLGQYIVKIYIETKSRLIYLLRKVV
ncbi:hypothetical protein KTC96_16910 [Clostridium estertheticum]|uniref:hypothetical protein n=1 Tax=Clostridium estertheticum TaxID=238834 RepID=UPI001C7CA040|nr:hypothetical protein [Clostridium estertheticum]MBX4258434.1 hypothetical protein [Clostridium estertheticum]WLC69612.1 hypothetical protein KTC96_16910 [Clostridium estertheticum]